MAAKKRKIKLTVNQRRFRASAKACKGRDKDGFTACMRKEMKSRAKKKRR